MFEWSPKHTDEEITTNTVVMLTALARLTHHVCEIVPHVAPCRWIAMFSIRPCVPETGGVVPHIRETVLLRTALGVLVDTLEIRLAFSHGFVQ